MIMMTSIINGIRPEKIKEMEDNMKKIGKQAGLSRATLKISSTCHINLGLYPLSWQLPGQHTACH
jgi:hypothetical protein